MLSFAECWRDGGWNLDEAERAVTTGGGVINKGERERRWEEAAGCSTFTTASGSSRYVQDQRWRPHLTAALVTC